MADKTHGAHARQMGFIGRAIGLFGITLLTVLVLAASADAAESKPESAKGKDKTSVQHRTPASKPAHARIPAGYSRDRLEVKFKEGSAVRFRGGRFASVGDDDLSALNAVMQKRPGTTIGRSFDASEAALAAEKHDVEQLSGREQGDKNLYFRLALQPDTDPIAFLDDLNALDIVEVAYAQPIPTKLPVSPNYVSYQGYRRVASSSGIDADYAWYVAGGRGQNVKIIDIEYSWNRSHEDLSKAWPSTALIPNGTPTSAYSDDHGTAVLGEITGDANTSGVTGLADAAAIGLVNAANAERGWDVGNSVYKATQYLRAGDVLLIEQQVGGPKGCNAQQVGCVAVEWIPSWYDAIVSATSKGIIVVEAAGNGWQNLDDPAYGAAFPGGRANSGAIIVGAGGAGCSTTARSRMNYSNYGSRIDLQGWGECVMTTGYGALQGGSNRNVWYTGSFSGTSSASPIVASAAAVLSSVAKQRGYLLTPQQVRSTLRSTGMAQAAGLAGNIGPLPNLRKAIESLSVADATAPTISSPAQYVDSKYTLGSTIPVLLKWTSSDASGVERNEIGVSINGGAWSVLTDVPATATSTTRSLTPGTKYAFRVRARDRAGNWSGYAQGPAFVAGVYEDNGGWVTWGSGGGWRTASWTPASGGTITYTGTAGATASFSFTGRSVAWIGTRDPSRGKANVYLDGTFVETVDLYSATSTARSVLSSWTWTSSAQHKIEIKVLGTSGRPTVDVDTFVRLQ